ncbi:endoribonuclease l-PSP domain-containing protein [Sarocladium implicatum]|nr:endoribonuclease l-PSP domain-containing protein [Sarocladium implicatum]
MSRVAVRTNKAPPPKPIFNQAIIANGFVFCSGQVGRDANGKDIEGTVQDRTHQAIANLRAVLEEAGSCLENVVKVNIFLSDINNFAKVNEVYVQYFGDVKPARTCVAAKTLPGNTDVEIECVGLVGQPKARL